MARHKEDRARRLERTLRPKRPKPYRSKRTRVLVVGDGRKTEPNYFEGMKQDDRVRNHVVLIVKRGAGGSAVETVKTAIKAKQDAKRSIAEPFNEIWCLLDVEGQGADHRDTLKRARSKAVDKGVKVILSNPCFEVWLLAHFERTSRHFSDASAVVQALNSYWKPKFNQDYAKNDPGLYRRLCGLTDRAIKHAQEVREIDHRSKPDTADCNSSTEVYKLVAMLLGSNATPASRICGR